MVYVVERYLPGVSEQRLRGLMRDLQDATLTLRAEGADVRYLGSTIVPGDEACFCQFEAPSETVVAEANRRAAFPFDRIVAGRLELPRHHDSEGRQGCEGESSRRSCA